MAEGLEPLVWHTEQRKISELIPNPKNPRRLTEDRRQLLEDSINKFNLVEIPVINLDGMLLAGHQRLKVMSMLGRSEEITDVRVPNRKLTDEEVSEYTVRSNVSIGDWDYDELANSFDREELIDWGFDNLDWDEEDDEDLEGANGEIKPEHVLEHYVECPRCKFKFEINKGNEER